MDLIKDLFKGDKVIWIIFLFLCLISIVEVFSAASTLTYKSGFTISVELEGVSRTFL